MTTAQQVTAKLNFKAPVDALLEATSKVLSVVPAKSPKPVLSNIRFTVQEGVLELAGTDAVTGIYYSIPAATIKTEGHGLLNGARFSELLKEFRGVDAQMVFDPRGGCQFKAKGGRYKIIGDDPRDYPKIPRFETKKGVGISGDDIVDMVKKTSPAVAPEESRLTTHGVLFDLNKERLRLAATDNKRMSVTERPVTDNVAEFSESLPEGFLNAVIKVTTKDVAGNIATIGVSGKKLFYRLPSATVYSTVLQGDYPPYHEALSIELKHHIDCNVKDLLNTLRRAILVNSNLIAFNFETDVLSLKGATTAIGVGVADMPIGFELAEGQEKIRAGFNPTFYKDALEVMTTKRCRFYFEGPRNAGILKGLVDKDGVEAESDQFIYIVMPALLPAEAD
jgi:DNA polymerase-3 subunit beta